MEHRPDGTGTALAAGAPFTPAANTTLYAQWTPTRDNAPSTLPATGGEPPYGALTLAIVLLGTGGMLLLRRRKSAAN